MKKCCCMLLCAVLLVGCASTSAPATDGTTSPEMTPSTAGIYQAGTYTATADGNNGPLTVQVTFSTSAIEQVEVTEQSETESIASEALESIPAAIVEAQSTEVDTVSSATVTSNAILSAVNDCIEQAGGTVESESAFAQGEDVSTQIVVVGGGLAGLSAALSAANQGSEVILVEKQGQVGGSALLTGAGIYATETDVVPASVETQDEMYEHILDMIDDGGTLDHVDTDRIRHLVDESDDIIAWLESLGMEFSAGSVGILNAKEHYHSLADGSSGPGQVAIMEEAAKEAGVQILLNTQCVALLDDNGTVTGITVEDSNANTTYNINAQAVILAAGGYAQNEEMMRRYMPASLYSTTLANIGATGEVIDQALAVGASLYPYQFMLACGTSTDVSIGLNMAAATGAFVNSNGRRFCNEHRLWQIDAEMVNNADLAPYYVIYDSTHISQENVAALDAAVADHNPYVIKADTLEELARKADLKDVEGFVQDLENYSSVAGTDQLDPDFGVPGDRVVAVTDGPFYAVIVYPINAGTIGGIRTNISGEVLDAEDNAIAGLYAAGEISNGDLYDNGYISGTSVLNCYVAGRDAGNSAAAYVSGN